MAKRPELQHSPTQALQRNRRRLEDSQANIDKVMDRPSKDGPRERQPRLEGAARNLKGKAVDFEIVEGRSDDALGIKNHRVKRELKAQENVEKRQPGRSDTRKSDLSIPIVRAKRMATDDGRTSFHFSHDSISKTNREVISETGRANRPGAAKSHNKYIERESAVAIDAAGIETVAGNDNKINAVAIAGNDIANDNGGAAANQKETQDGRKQQPAADGAENSRITSRDAARKLRLAGAGLANDVPWPERDPNRGPADRPYGLRDLSPGSLVPDGREAEMLLFGDAAPVVGRGGEADPSVRPQGAGDRRDQRQERSGWLKAVPAFLRPRDPNRDAKPLEPVPAFVHPRTVEAPASPESEPQAANDLRTPDGQGKYIERQEALAIQPDGTRVLFTNIDEDPVERAEFWRLVEKHEYDASPDKIAFTINKDPEFWERAAAHPECPKDLREAIASADPDKRISVESGDNVSMRKFLAKIDGWDSCPQREGEVLKDYYARRSIESLASFQDGRGGRVQFRIIGELPYELDVAGRASVLKKFTEEFERRRLPFVAVMHAPDHTNSDKNWHFHLVYYDRPCNRVTRQQVEENATRRNDAGEIKRVEPNYDHVGQWDFTVNETYLRPGRYEKRENYPYAQKKVAEVAQDNKWIEILRKKLADITNDHLEEAGIARRLDPRTHEEMGIHSDPQEHLGTKLANLEAMGIATPTGVSNEERQWAAVLKKLNSDLDKRKAAVDRQATKWLKQIEQSGLADEVQRNVRGSVTRWHQHRTEAEEQEAIAINVDEHVERLTSRATKVLATCRKHIEAIEDGRASKFQQSRLKPLETKADEAQAWLAEAAKMIDKELELSRDARRAAESERLVADVLENGIEKALLAGGRSTARRAPEREAANDQDRHREEPAARRAANADVEAWIREIEQRRRRLKRVGRDTVPATMNDADRAMVESENYAGVRNRLKALKDRQDKIIADVAVFVAQSPESVVTRMANGRQTHVLVGARPALAEAFRDYQQDPALIKARDEALAAMAEARREKSEVAADTRRDNAEAAEREDAARRRQAEPAQDRKREDVARQRAISEGIVRAIRNSALRIIVKEGVASLSPADTARARTTAEQLADPDIQSRLVGLAKTQQGEFKRLAGYVRSSPKSLIDREKGFALRADVPADIAEIARRWQNDQVLAGELRAVRDGVLPKARQQGLPLEEPRTAPVPDRTPQRDTERPVAPATEGRPTPPAERPVQPAPALPDDRSRRPDDERRETPKPVAPTAPVPAADRPDVARPSTERITTLAPDVELRQQAQRRANEQRLAQEAAEARRNASRGRGRTDAADAPERVTRTAAQAAAMATAHPLIREWDKANSEGRTDDRKRIAAEIVADRAARVDLQKIERNIARRIREEADRVIAARQPDLGLGLDQGPSLKRDDD